MCEQNINTSITNKNQTRSWWKDTSLSWRRASLWVQSQVGQALHGQDGASGGGGGARPLWARWPPGTCYGLEKVLKYCFILCFQFWKLIEVCLMAKHGHFWWLSISALGEVCVLQMSGAVSYEVIVWFEFSPYWLICIDRVCQCGGGALKSPTLTVRDLVFCSSISFAL